MKETIKTILRESLDTTENPITKLSIFDFDGTLVDTPLPDTGRTEYETKTGKKWPHEGWWGRSESLDQTVFEMPIIKNVVDAYAREKVNPSTLTVMMTGRMVKLQNDVKAILDKKGLVFDKYIYNRGGNTLDAKLKSLDDMIKVYPNVKSVEMWDDRLEHIPSFEKWGKEHPELEFKMNIVPGSHHK